MFHERAMVIPAKKKSMIAVVIPAWSEWESVDTSIKEIGILSVIDQHLCDNSLIYLILIWLFSIMMRYNEPFPLEAYDPAWLESQIWQLY